MLRRLYVHNFRTLVNFTIEFDAMNLLLGSNGSGKSSVFDVLSKLQSFLSGERRRVEEVFRIEDTTRWESQEASYQQFEIEWQVEDNNFVYKLRVEHTTSEWKTRIGSEELLHDGQRLYYFDANGEGLGEVFHDDYTLGGKFLTDGISSGIQAFDKVTSNSKLIAFQSAIRSLTVVRFNLPRISSQSHREADSPDYGMENFASWFRHLIQSQPSQVFALTIALREILPGFDSMSFQSVGESKYLNVEFVHERGENISYRFSQLSDGQKALILLYTLLYCLSPKNRGVLCIDEPENFLALPEVQLWLDALERRVLDGRIQAVLISHHPRLINMLAGDCGQWLHRDSGSSPTRIRPVALDAPDGLSAAKLVEMGWLVND